MNRKRNNTSFSVQNITAKSILKNSDRCHISLLFITITKILITQQLNYLKALMAEEKAISSTEVMHRYQISSTTSIFRSKVVLIQKDILDNKPGEISFKNRIYVYWLKNESFTKRIILYIWFFRCKGISDIQRLQYEISEEFTV